jgi:hypothetical protein
MRFTVLFIVGLLALAAPAVAQEKPSLQAEVLLLQSKVEALERKFEQLTTEAIKSGALSEKVNTFSQNPAAALAAYAESARKIAKEHTYFMIAAFNSWTLNDTVKIDGVYRYGVYLTHHMDSFRKNPSMLRALYNALPKQDIVSALTSCGNRCIETLPALTTDYDPAVGELAATKGYRCRGDYRDKECTAVGKVIGDYYGVENPSFNLVWAAGALHRTYKVGGIEAVKEFQSIGRDALALADMVKN